LHFPYVSVVEHPGVVLIVRDRVWQEVVIDMIKAILNIWPLVLMNLLIMMVAGFIVWLLVSFSADTRDFKDTFLLKA